MARVTEETPRAKPISENRLAQVRRDLEPDDQGTLTARLIATIDARTEQRDALANGVRRYFVAATRGQAANRRGEPSSFAETDALIHLMDLLVTTALAPEPEEPETRG